AALQPQRGSCVQPARGKHDPCNKDSSPDFRSRAKIASSHQGSSSMKTFFAVSLLSICLLAWRPIQASPLPTPDDHLGKVEFAATCSSVAQPLIEKGAALLHSFQYLQSENTFTDAAKQDP